MKTKKVKLESLKLEFHVDFYPHHLPPPYKSRLKNLIFILELEFWTLEMLISNIVLQRDN